MNKRLLLWVGIVGLMLSFGLLFGSILLFRLFLLTVFILFIGYFWVIFSIRKLILQIGEPPVHLQVNDEFQREIKLTNSGLLPRLWLRLVDQTDLGEQDSTIISLPGRATRSWKTNFKCRQRGLYHLGPIAVIATDPLGIFSRRVILGDAQPVIVFPKTVDLPHFKFSSFSDARQGKGYRSITPLSPNASSIREFVSGDSLRHIHWQSTLRSGKLMAKTFDADRSYNASKIAWILMDMNEESHFGWQSDTTDEEAVVIAASIAQNYLESGIKLGIMVSDENRLVFPPERGEQQLWKIMEKLALVKTTFKTTLNGMITGKLDIFRDNPMVILVGTTASYSLTDIVRQIRPRVSSVVAVLIDTTGWKNSPDTSELPGTISWAGAQVYMVRKGDKLSSALDSKISHLHPAMV